MIRANKAISIQWGRPGIPQARSDSICRLGRAQISCQAILQILCSGLAVHPQIVQRADRLRAMLVDPAQQQELAPCGLPAQKGTQRLRAPGLCNEAEDIDIPLMR